MKEDVGGGGEERRKRREEKRDRRVDSVKKKNRKHPGSLPLPPTLPLSLFLTFFLSVAVHKTSSSAIRATWPLGP